MFPAPSLSVFSAPRLVVPLTCSCVAVTSFDSLQGGDEAQEQQEAIQAGVFQQYLEACDEAEVDEET